VALCTCGPSGKWLANPQAARQSVRATPGRRNYVRTLFKRRGVSGASLREAPARWGAALNRPSWPAPPRRPSRAVTALARPPPSAPFGTPSVMALARLPPAVARGPLPATPRPAVGKGTPAGRLSPAVDGGQGPRQRPPRPQPGPGWGWPCLGQSRFYGLKVSQHRCFAAVLPCGGQSCRCRASTAPAMGSVLCLAAKGSAGRECRRRRRNASARGWAGVPRCGRRSIWGVPPIPPGLGRSPLPLVAVCCLASSRVGVRLLVELRAWCNRRRGPVVPLRVTPGRRFCTYFALFLISKQMQKGC